jgi:hypothetical protein
MNLLFWQISICYINVIINLMYRTAERSICSICSEYLKICLHITILILYEVNCTLVTLLKFIQPSIQVSDILVITDCLKLINFLFSDLRRRPVWVCSCYLYYHTLYCSNCLHPSGLHPVIIAVFPPSFHLIIFSNPCWTIVHAAVTYINLESL